MMYICLLISAFCVCTCSTQSNRMRAGGMVTFFAKCVPILSKRFTAVRVNMNAKPMYQQPQVIRRSCIG